MRIPTPNTGHLHLFINIESLDILMLLGLPEYYHIIYYINYIIFYRTENRANLPKFFHISTKTLFNLLGKYKNSGDTGRVRKLIEEVTASCSRWNIPHHLFNFAPR